MFVKIIPRFTTIADLQDENPRILKIVDTRFKNSWILNLGL